MVEKSFKFENWSFEVKIRVFIVIDLNKKLKKFNRNIVHKKNQITIIQIFKEWNSFVIITEKKRLYVL